MSDENEAVETVTKPTAVSVVESQTIMILTAILEQLVAMNKRLEAEDQRRRDLECKGQLRV